MEHQMTLVQSQIRGKSRVRSLLVISAFALMAGVADVVIAQPASCTNGGTAPSASPWRRWECILEVQSIGSALTGRNPYKTELRVTYRNGSATRIGYAAFDGMNSTNGKYRFLLRTMFPSYGTWTWTTSCETPAYCGSNSTIPSLAGTGSVLVEPGSVNSADINRLYEFGQLGVREVSWNEGTGWREWGSLWESWGREFAWIGDSAWAAPMKATTNEWYDYLTKRKAAGVTIIHIGPAPLWAGSTDTSDVAGQTGNPPFDTIPNCSPIGVIPNNCSVPNMAFWRRFEGKIETANQVGIHIFLTGLMEPVSRPPYPSTTEAVCFARWLAARLSGNHVIFSPGFDSSLQATNEGSLQNSVGLAIKAVAPTHLVTNHWNTNEPNEIAALHDKDWLAFEMVQSGFADKTVATITRRARVLPWQVSGASNPGVAPFNGDRKATVNGEAVYDEGGAASNPLRPAFTDFRARQAGYLSWLSGAFGYSWGVGGIWDWGLCAKPLPNACGTAQNGGWVMPPGWDKYSSALTRPSATHIKSFGQLVRSRMALTTYGWMDAYEQDRILNQVPDTEQHKKMVLARNWEWMLAYLPHNQTIRIRYTATSSYYNINPFTGKLFNPIDGTYAEVRAGANPNVTCTVGGTDCTWTNRFYTSTSIEGTVDRVLILTRGAANTWSLTNTSNLEASIGRPTKEDPIGIYGQMVDSSGQPIGNSFAISSVGGLEPSNPAVGRDGKGRYLVTWQSDADFDGLLEIWGRWIADGLGSAVEPAFRISPVDGNEHVDSAVAVTQGGEAAVTWTSIGPAAENAEIWGRGVGANASNLGLPQQICAGSEVACFNSKVGANIQGNISIGWIEQNLALDQARVMYQTFGSPDLIATNWPQQVNSVGNIGFWLINLHVDSAGLVRVEYEGRQGGASGGVYIQAFDASGAKSGGESLVSPPYPET
jgi:Protein of unknown function (DUF4038)